MISPAMSLLLGFALALGFTILIEWGLSCLFLDNKHDRKLVVLAQCLTNPLLNITFVALSALIGVYGSPLLLLTLELLVVIFEGLIYKAGFKNKKVKPFLLSLSLNTASIILGYFLMMFASFLLR